MYNTTARKSCYIPKYFSNVFFFSESITSRTETVTLYQSDDEPNKSMESWVNKRLQSSDMTIGLQAGVGVMYVMTHTVTPPKRPILSEPDSHTSRE